MTQTRWLATTRFHDWSDRVYPAALIDHALEVGALGKTTWVIPAEGKARAEVDIGPPNMGSRLLALVPPRTRVAFLEAGGDGWSLHVVLPSFLETTKRLNGIGIVSLLFDRPRLESVVGSDELWRVFQDAHAPSNTEYAGIHPYTAWERLRSTTYNPAVTYDPMFAGAVWANFLGPGHVEQFDRSKLSGVNAKWQEDGVYFRDQGPLAEAQSPAAEARLLQVTDAFRSARIA
jgi:hypothetical protein